MTNANVCIVPPQISESLSGSPSTAVFPLGIPSTGTPFLTPVTQPWNLSVQHQLARGTVLEAAYAGSGGNHLSRQLQLNQPLPQAARPAPGSTLNLARPYQGVA